MKVTSVREEALHEVVLAMSCSARCRGLFIPMYYKKIRVMKSLLTYVLIVLLLHKLYS